MTIGEYIKEKLEQFGIEYSNNMLAAEMSKVELTDIGFSKEHAKKVDLLFYNIIPDILLMPANISEGGYSISYNKEAVISYYNLLCRKLNRPNLLKRNTITDITQKWQ